MAADRASEVIGIENAVDIVGEEVHEACRKTVLHRAGAAETSMFQVAPGGTVRAHYHSNVWDLFFGVVGRGEIVYGEGLSAGTVKMHARSFCAMPPGVPHEVRNVDPGSTFVFLLVHAPYEGYDHLPYRSDEKGVPVVPPRPEGVDAHG